MSGSGSEERELQEARETIGRLAAENERLRGQLETSTSVADFVNTLNVLAAAGVIASPSPHNQLVELIVETAARIIDARAAALFLIDEEENNLVFEVALGEKADEVEKYRVPIGHGIAGLVAASGQPLAISDAQSDPRHAADIAQHVGYLPDSILCVPLFLEDRVIGVFELLDKEGAPSFSEDDIQALGLFARQAAIAIESSHVHRTLASLLEELIGLSGRPEHERQPLQQRIDAFLATLSDGASHRRSLELARIVSEIANEGENESKACEAVLRDFADYLRARRQPLDELGELT